MKRILCQLFFTLFLFCSEGMSAELPYLPENFRYSAAVHGPLRQAALYQIHLNEAALEKCGVGCRDLRIFDAQNREIPYVIIENRNDARRPETYTLEVIGFDEQPAETVVTLKMPEKHYPITRMVLEIPEQDFRKDIVLEGSADARSWTFLAKDQIYDFTSQVDLRKKHVSFKTSDFRYYRLALKDDKKKSSGDEKVRLTYRGLDLIVSGMQTKKLHISRAVGQTFSETESTATYDEERLTAFRSEQDKDRNTVITFESGLPFTRIAFDLANPYFYRRALLYSSETGKENSYVLQQEASLYRFLLSDIIEKKSDIAAGISGRRFHRIVIENGSNPPLNIKGIRLGWVQKLLYFVALSDVPSYAVGFGNAEIALPVYDLSSSVNQANWQKFSPEKVELRDTKQNPDFKPGLKKDVKARREKIILTGIICLLVVGIGFWLYLLLRKAGKKTLS